MENFFVPFEKISIDYQSIKKTKWKFFIFHKKIVVFFWKYEK